MQVQQRYGRCLVELQCVFDNGKPDLSWCQIMRMLHTRVGQYARLLHRIRLFSCHMQMGLDDSLWRSRGVLANDQAWIYPMLRLFF